MADTSNDTTFVDKRTVIETSWLQVINNFFHTLFAGATTVTEAQQALSVEPGVDVQAYDAQLTDIAGLTPADGNIIVGDGANFVAESGATARTSLGAQAQANGLDDIGGLAVTDGNFIVGNGTNWVAESGATARTSLGLGDAAVENVTDIMPVGVILPYGGSSAPTGFLLCDGDAVSRTTYSALFAAIGTSFGVGNGSTTFNLPDMRGRVPLGLDNLGGVSANTVTNAAADSIGGTEGAEDHTLIVAELASHTHSYTIATNRNNTGSSSGTTDYWVNDTSALTGSNGSNTAHNNMQPYLTTNYIIRA